MSQLHKKKPLKIEPFRHRVEVDPRYAEKTWKVIEDAINEIYNRNASGLSFEELYRWNHFIFIQTLLLVDGLRFCSFFYF